jgi:peptidoglycan/LPS O-acetylase OafA/YrhL
MGGNISYSVYLIHTLIISVVLRFTINLSSTLPLGKYGIFISALILTLTVTFVVSHFLYVLVEKPFINYGKKFVQNYLERTNKTVNIIRDSKLPHEEKVIEI